MLENRRHIFLTILIAVFGSIIGHPSKPYPSISLDLYGDGISEDTLDKGFPVEAEINAACIDYLKSKGLNGIDSIKTSNIPGFFSIGYAFTIPPDAKKYCSTIFISPSMVESIKTCLAANQPMSIRDKFTLLHESGHLHPAGHPQSEIYSHVRKIHVLETCGLCGISFSVLGFALFEKSKIAKKFFPISFLLSIGFLGASIYTYHTKYLPFLRLFKKYRLKKITFTHADKKFEEHVTKACEEWDADLFAFGILSTQELNELHTYFSYYANLHKNIPVDMRDNYTIIDENAYHPTLQERCTMIQAELEKRKI